MKNEPLPFPHSCLSHQYADGECRYLGSVFSDSELVEDLWESLGRTLLQADFYQHPLPKGDSILIRRHGPKAGDLFASRRTFCMNNPEEQIGQILLKALLLHTAGGPIELKNLLHFTKKRA